MATKAKARPTRKKPPAKPKAAAKPKPEPDEGKLNTGPEPQPDKAAMLAQMHDGAGRALDALANVLGASVLSVPPNQVNAIMGSLRQYAAFMRAETAPAKEKADA